MAPRRKFFCREREEPYSVGKSRAFSRNPFQFRQAGAKLHFNGHAMRPITCEDEDYTINPKKEGVEDASKCSGTGQHAERQRETALNTRTSGRSKLSEKQRSSSWLSFNDADYKAECRICTLKKSVWTASTASKYREENPASYGTSAHSSRGIWFFWMPPYTWCHNVDFA